LATTDAVAQLPWKRKEIESEKDREKIYRADSKDNLAPENTDVSSEREALPVSPASNRNLAGLDGDGGNGTSRIYTAESQHNLAGVERDLPSKR
jgi:hypothetical protein